MRSDSLRDLYLFVGSSSTTNNFALSTVVSSVDLWHWRLDHPSSASLSTLISWFHLPCVPLIVRHPQFVRRVKRANMFVCLFLDLIHIFHFKLYNMTSGPLILRVLPGSNIIWSWLMIILGIHEHFLYALNLMWHLHFVISMFISSINLVCPSNVCNVIMAKNLIIASCSPSSMPKG
jgi:hypothetical protein